MSIGSQSATGSNPAAGLMIGSPFDEVAEEEGIERKVPLSGA